MRGAGPFSDRIESSVPSAVLQVLRWGRRSATLRSVFAAHGPTSCFSPTRTGVLADLSRCKPLPGIAVNGALVWRQVTAAICGSTSGALAGPDNAGYRWAGGARFCSQRRCNYLTGTPDERPRAARLRSISQSARSAPPSHRDGKLATIRAALGGRTRHRAGGREGLKGQGRVDTAAIHPPRVGAQMRPTWHFAAVRNYPGWFASRVRCRWSQE